MTTNFFSPLSFVAVFGSGMGKNQDPGSGINIPGSQHCPQHCPQHCKEGNKTTRNIICHPATICRGPQIAHKKLCKCYKKYMD
jgi:hypothetical protein